MGQIVIVYYSETGNTEAMANMVAKGVEAAGATAKVVPVDGFNAEELKGESAFALGCPAMGDEVLEEGTMEPFVAEVEKFASGKKIALFGSYGWGDGEWMRNWVDQMKNAGAFSSDIYFAHIPGGFQDHIRILSTVFKLFGCTHRQPDSFF